MSDFDKIVKKEIDKLDRILKKINAFLRDAPEGCLKWQNKKDKTYYYQQYWDKDKWKRKYIKKEELNLAKKLAQKHYYLLVKPILENQMTELKQFINKWSDSKIEEIYDELSVERKNLVVPLYMSVRERVKKWKEEEDKNETLYPEYLKYETEQGVKKSFILILRL